MLKGSYMLGIILYAILGFCLGAFGLNVVDHTWEFLTILAIVIAIDITSNRGLH